MVAPIELNVPVEKTLTVASYKLLQFTWDAQAGIIVFVFDPCDANGDSLGLPPRIQRYADDGSGLGDGPSLGDNEFPAALAGIAASAAFAANNAGDGEDLTGAGVLAGQP